MSFQSFFGYEVRAGDVSRHFPEPGCLLHLSKVALSGPIPPKLEVRLMIAVHNLELIDSIEDLDLDLDSDDDGETPAGGEGSQSKSSPPTKKKGPSPARAAAVADASRPEGDDEDEAAGEVDGDDESEFELDYPFFIVPPPGQLPYYCVATLTSSRPDASLDLNFGIADVTFFRIVLQGAEVNAKDLPPLHVTGYYTYSDEFLVGDDDDGDSDSVDADIAELIALREREDELAKRIGGDEDSDSDEYDVDYAIPDEDEKKIEDGDAELEREMFGDAPIFEAGKPRSSLRRDVMAQAKKKLRERFEEGEYDETQDGDFVPTLDVDEQILARVVARKLAEKRKRRLLEGKKSHEARMQAAFGLNDYDSDEDEDFVPSVGDDLPDDHVLPPEAVEVERRVPSSPPKPPRAAAPAAAADADVPPLVPQVDARRAKKPSKRDKRRQKKIGRKERRGVKVANRQKPVAPAPPLQRAPKSPATRSPLTGTKRPRQRSGGDRDKASGASGPAKKRRRRRQKKKGRAQQKQ